MAGLYETIETDILIIGAGGTGLRAAIESAKFNVDTIVLGKELLGKAHTVMAEGGYNAALGNADARDNWEVHFQDTIEGGVWLNDQDLAEILVKEAIDRVYDLEDYGGAFDRSPDGKLAQRTFGKAKYPRTVYASDYTGHEMMATLSEEVRRHGIPIMEEVFVTKLFTNQGIFTGALAFNVVSGNFILFRSKAAILATGGAGRMYPVTSNPAAATGDGRILALDVGAELLDMELYQFHPTGMVWPPSCIGTLVTEGVRAEGGKLLNSKGERFMEKYHKLLELGPRDVVARSIWKEIQEGRGSPHGGAYLSVTHLKPEVIRERLKTMYKQFLLAGVDMTIQPIEVAPTAHYYMGGVKTNVKTESRVKGLYAAGEEMGAVHGANRLGGNSIAATQVFGKRAGEYAALYCKEQSKRPIERKEIDKELKRIENFLSRKDRVSAYEIRKKLNSTMWANASISRTEASLSQALEDIERLKTEMLPRLGVTNNGSMQYNKELVEDMETVNLVRVAEILVKSAIMRRESRGAHYRLDYPQRDDKNWLLHIVWFLESGVLINKTEPVTITIYSPPAN